MPVIRKSNESRIGIKKAAILLITVGPALAAKILTDLSENEVESIMIEVANCNDVTNEDKEAVLEEFYEDYIARDSLDKGGMTYAAEVLEKAFGKKRAQEMLEKLSENISVGPFSFLKNTEPDHLVNFIKNEPPQTIALIHTYLS
jgi:flagellar motor switch protein FliG